MIEQARVNKLLCSSLAPDFVARMYAHYSRSKPDYEVKYFDGDLVDCFIELFEIGNRGDLVVELRKSLKDKDFTKRFYHIEPTLGNLEHFLDPELEVPSFRWNKNFKAASALLRSMLKLPKLLTPIKVDDKEDLLKVWSNAKASSGFVGAGSKIDNIDQIYSGLQKLIDLIDEDTPYEQIQIPCVMFHRAQFSEFLDEIGHYHSGGKLKDRFIWGMDGVTVSLEGMFARPLIDYLIQAWPSYSGGDDPETLRFKINRAYSSGWDWISLDFSKFDQTVQSWLICEAFDIIKCFFEEKYHKYLNFIAYNFIHTWVLLPGGGLVQKHRGIPSGSNFTQVVGSMCNVLMLMTYLASRHDGSVEDKVSYVQRNLSPGRDPATFVMGDDNMTFFAQRIDVVDLAGYVNHVFGVMIHPEKTITSRDQSVPHYLKRDWYATGEYRYILDLAISVCHPERVRNYTGFSPWHIMYGLFLTYSKAFEPLCDESLILKRMQSAGGISGLESLELHDLPGPLRGYGDRSRGMLLRRAKTLIRSMAV